MSDYFNTTQESCETLKSYRSKAKTETEEIFLYMSRYDFTYGASDILMELYPGVNKPITNIRRSLTGLKQEGLIKVVGKQIGMYGRPENMYQVVHQVGQVEMF
jgi:hypothetical protein